MGKVRIKTIGIEEVEKKQKDKAKKRKEAKKEKKTAKGAHGGERVVSMAPSEEELEKIKIEEEKPATKSDLATTQTAKEVEAQKPKARPTRQRSHHYKEKLALIDRKKTYGLSEALELLKSASWRTKFDGTVELHINTIDKGLSGQVTLPHGTGKQTRVAIADDKIIEDIAKGKIDFDILLAHPEMMPKLAKVAKILGPRGLMPNPKNGTITDAPEKLAEKFTAGQINFRTESQAPIIHLSVGKLSMKDDELVDNITTILVAIGSGKIKNVTLKSTMSPGIKLDLASNQITSNTVPPSIAPPPKSRSLILSSLKKSHPQRIAKRTESLKIAVT